MLCIASPYQRCASLQGNSCLKSAKEAFAKDLKEHKSILISLILRYEHALGFNHSEAHEFW